MMVPGGHLHVRPATGTGWISEVPRPGRRAVGVATPPSELTRALAGLLSQRMTYEGLRQIEEQCICRLLSCGSRAVVMFGRGDGGRNPIDRHGHGDVSILEPLVGRAGILTAFSRSVLRDSARGIHTVRVPSGDPLSRQRFLVITTDSTTSALVAERSSSGDDTLLDVVLTSDPTRVAAITSHLIGRMVSSTRYSSPAASGDAPAGEPRDSRARAQWWRPAGR